MSKTDILNQEIGRFAVQCNANLVVAYKGKKLFWFYECLKEASEKFPDMSMPLSLFCVCVEQRGVPCNNKEQGVSFTLVARNVPREEALKEY